VRNFMVPGSFLRPIQSLLVCAAALAGAFFLQAPVFAQSETHTDAKTTGTTATSATDELAAMYEVDQNDRKEVEKYTQPGYWATISKRDKQHHDRVIELMKADKLVSGDDYFYAAMIMQHGNTPKDYMLAHVFATAAAQRGNKPAVWLSAASFDRLMVSAGQPQIFGTQYFSDANAPYKMKEPLDADLISDSVRKAFNVPAMAENEERLKKLNAQKK